MNEIVTTVVTAVTLGAAAGLQETVTQMVEDAYLGLKRAIQEKYGNANLEIIEQIPNSETQQVALAEYLQHKGAGEDHDLLRKAQLLILLIEEHEPETKAVVDIHIKDVAGRSFKFDGASATGDISSATFKMEQAHFDDDVRIGKMEAGEKADTSKKK